MSVTLDEMKTYLRVDSGDEDALIESLLAAAKKLCMAVARCDSEEEFEAIPVS
ncbi:head-tail connector protein, partial [Clostridium sp. SL.3.18]|nr:head-tail connector protein [Clostridium sp. SL.3.18]